VRERPRYVPPVVTRSRLVLEMAYELVGERNWDARQARIMLRVQGSKNPWTVTLDGSDTPSSIDLVARGEAQIAIINPANPLGVALRGNGPFREPIPVRVITVIPSLDQLAFAVHERTGIRSLAELRQRKYPLKISMRSQAEHSTYFIAGEALNALGFSLADIVSWGGSMHYHPYPPDVDAVVRGDVDAIFDEAVDEWADRAIEAGMRFLSLDEAHLQQMEAMGFRRARIKKSVHPGLSRDVDTLDFSGWPIFTHANAPDDLVRACCAALEASKERIPWQGVGPLPLERMCLDTEDAPLTAPLHPAAERFWRERGYIT